jgi:hypothetical protein
MQSWEYCAIVGVAVTSGGRLLADQERSIHFFTERGVRMVKVNVDDQNALAQAIAGLGADGWELVGCGNTGLEDHVLYFKRPVSE